MERHVCVSAAIRIRRGADAMSAGLRVAIMTDETGWHTRDEMTAIAA